MSVAVSRSPDRISSAEAAVIIETRVKAAGTSFFWAMRLLNPPRRAAMFAIYAFCREVDDVADRDGPNEAKLIDLAEWRREIDRLYDGHATTLVGQALLEPIIRYDLRRPDFLAVIDGMEMDALTTIMAPSLDELDLYCSRVASAVGHLSVRAFGDASPSADQVAHHLGRALQLTNILRDIAEDAERGRLYLPRDLLTRHGMSADSAAQIVRDPRLPLVCRDLAEIARQHFVEATAAIGRSDRRAMRPAVLMQVMYRAILDRLIASEWRDLDRRIKLGRVKQIWLILRFGVL